MRVACFPKIKFPPNYHRYQVVYSSSIAAVARYESIGNGIQRVGTTRAVRTPVRRMYDRFQNAMEETTAVGTHSKLAPNLALAGYIDVRSLF